MADLPDYLKDGGGAVKKHRTGSNHEETEMRSISELRDLAEWELQDQIGCNQSLKQNVARNIFGGRLQRQRYRCGGTGYEKNCP